MSSNKNEDHPGTPRRFIFNDADMVHFRQSKCKAELVKFTTALGTACATRVEGYLYDPNQPLVNLSPAMAVLHGGLRAMLDWLLELPPSNSNAGRFGNPVYKTWHARLAMRSPALISSMLQAHRQHPFDPEDPDCDVVILKECADAGRRAVSVDPSSDGQDHPEAPDRTVVTELCAYFQQAFGHPVRIDYGTGHECSFQVFLYCWCIKLGAWGSTRHTPPSMERLQAVTLSIYHAYLLVTRQIQTDYMLEPAGSHGVWGLDDYHCLPFYFGACQMQLQQEWMPSAIHSDTLLRQEGDAYLYFGCIRFIKSLKKGVPFFEHSPMLNDISQIPRWSKVASGLLRLFEGEVLDKRQVVQHFVFGNLFIADWEPSQKELPHAPSATFREAGPMARAPWAEDEGAARPHEPMESTRAPWAR